MYIITFNSPLNPWKCLAFVDNLKKSSTIYCGTLTRLQNLWRTIFLAKKPKLLVYLPFISHHTNFVQYNKGDLSVGFASFFSQQFLHSFLKITQKNIYTIQKLEHIHLFAFHLNNKELVCPCWISLSG